MFDNRLTENERLKIQSYDRETLEEKFVNMYLKHKESMSNNDIDFENHKIKRRQQYLHKSYTKNSSALNKMLSILLETKDENLQKYFNKLNKELEIEAQKNNDTQ